MMRLAMTLDDGIYTRLKASTSAYLNFSLLSDSFAFRDFKTTSRTPTIYLYEVSSMSEIKETLTLPPWLNESFMESTLKKSFNDKNFKILESRVELATSVGDHYGSQMFRFNLKISGGNEEKLSVIVKILPAGVLKEKMEVFDAFEVEAEAFIKILPAVQEVVERAYPNHEKLWAHCYHFEESHKVIVLEDLKQGGFTLGPRLPGLDEDHIHLVLRSMAKMHASSLLVKEKVGTKNSCFWSRQNVDLIKPILKIPFWGLLKAYDKWPEFKGKALLLEKLKNLDIVLLEKIFKAFERDQSKMNVLLHGDSWVNNFMFRYDDDHKPSAMKFVDFQLVSWNSPSLDLQYFIFTSARPDLKFNQIDTFLQIYHEAFEETLKRLGHHPDVPFGLNDLRDDFEDKYIWGFIVFCSIFPLICLPKKESFSPDDYFKTKDGSNFEEIYLREELREVLKRGLAFFEEKGVL